MITCASLRRATNRSTFSARSSSLRFLDRGATQDYRIPAHSILYRRSRLSVNSGRNRPATHLHFYPGILNGSQSDGGPSKHPASNCV
ncbi:hypothetical protein SISSUDRAFT_664193 [Sistotremastrum suecicum HHB10207 ss-3]|uniref:Uncharacterized protein n=1 Tax=Sistotremastrum suecicum HHB10207 ss-3 TaxID=1314776 RepID=A0A165X2P8_9AGAM|nr:hypothetical protein SISSUDRAFT_664193 [Sistotremastrum suecicum HHB10207 ss-3]